MLKFEYSEKGCSIQNSGTMEETILYCTFLIHELYCTMAAHNPIMGCLFKEAIIGLVASRESPVWDTSLKSKAAMEVFATFPPKKEK